MARNRVDELDIEIGKEYYFGYMDSIDHFNEDKRCFEKLHQEGKINLISFDKINEGIHIRLIKLK